MTKFLEARIAEDEEFADSLRDASFLGEDAYAIGIEYAARLRLEAAVRRAVLTCYYENPYSKSTELALRHLATVYGARPGYCEEWQP